MHNTFGTYQILNSDLRAIGLLLADRLQGTLRSRGGARYQVAVANPDILVELEPAASSPKDGPPGVLIRLTLVGHDDDVERHILALPDVRVLARSELREDRTGDFSASYEVPGTSARAVAGGLAKALGRDLALRRNANGDISYGFRTGRLELEVDATEEQTSAENPDAATRTVGIHLSGWGDATRAEAAIMSLPGARLRGRQLRGEQRSGRFYGDYGVPASDVDGVAGVLVDQLGGQLEPHHSDEWGHYQVVLLPDRDVDLTVKPNENAPDEEDEDDRYQYWRHKDLDVFISLSLAGDAGRLEQAILALPGVRVLSRHPADIRAAATATALH